MDQHKLEEKRQKLLKAKGMEVPGPGAYINREAKNVDLMLKECPSFLIMRHDTRGRQQLTKFNQPVLETNVGPGQYQNIKYVNHVDKCCTIGTSIRTKSKEHLNKPAPNAYRIPGDFDFKDLNKDVKEDSAALGRNHDDQFGK
jgi:hypothetical protein